MEVRRSRTAGVVNCSSLRYHLVRVEGLGRLVGGRLGVGLRERPVIVLVSVKCAAGLWERPTYLFAIIREEG